MEDEGKTIDLDTVRAAESGLIADVLGFESDVNIEEQRPHAIATASLIRKWVELHEELDDIEDKTKEQLESVREEFEVEISPDTIEKANRMNVAHDLGDEIFSFFTLAAGLIEIISVSLLEEEFIEEEFRGSNNTEKLLQRSFNQRMREDFLHRSGVIDGDLKTEMSRIRKRRNELVHNVEERFAYNSTDSLRSEIDRVIGTVEDLQDEAANDDLQPITIQIRETEEG